MHLESFSNFSKLKRRKYLAKLLGAHLKMCVACAMEIEIKCKLYHKAIMLSWPGGGIFFPLSSNSLSTKWDFLWDPIGIYVIVIPRAHPVFCAKREMKSRIIIGKGEMWNGEVVLTRNVRRWLFCTFLECG